MANSRYKSGVKYVYKLHRSTGKG